MESWANSTGSQYTDKLKEGSCKPLLEELPSGHVKENLSFYLQPKCMSSLRPIKRTVKTWSKVIRCKNWRGKRFIYLIYFCWALVLRYYWKQRSSLPTILTGYHFSFERYSKELPFVKLILPQNIYMGPSLERGNSTGQKLVIYMATSRRQGGKKRLTKVTFNELFS